MLFKMQRITFGAASRTFATSKPSRGLDEFFEDSKKGWVWDEKKLNTGRGWLAAELRKKSFNDLHSVWWACLKEQNKLASQQVEAKRFAFFYPFKARGRQVSTESEFK